jgi:arabinogalactan oligomer/maltooligosaccharide transport system permease protein
MRASMAQTSVAVLTTFLLFYPVLQIVLLSLNKIPYFRLGGDFVPTLESFHGFWNSPSSGAASSTA